MLARTNCWTNNWVADDLRCHAAYVTWFRLWYRLNTACSAYNGICPSAISWGWFVSKFPWYILFCGVVGFKPENFDCTGKCRMYATLYILAPISINFSPYFYYIKFRAQNDSIDLWNLSGGAYYYLQVSNISCTLVGNKIVEHSDVVGASPVGDAPTTSSFST